MIRLSKLLGVRHRIIRWAKTSSRPLVDILTKENLLNAHIIALLLGNHLLPLLKIDMPVGDVITILIKILAARAYVAEPTLVPTSQTRLNSRKHKVANH